MLSNKKYERFFEKLFGGDWPWLDYLLWLFIVGLFFTIVVLEVAAGIYTLLFIISIFYLRKKGVDRTAFLFILFVISALFSGILSGHFNILMYLVPVSFIPISVQLRKNTNFRIENWIGWITVFAAITAAVGFWYHFAGRERTTGTYGGYFIFATLMSCSIPLVIAFFIREKNKRAVLCFILAIFMTVALWWSYTRSAMLGLFIGLGIWAFTDLIKKIFSKQDSLGRLVLRWMFALTPLMLLIIFILFTDDPRMNPTVKNQTQNEQNFDVTSGRSDIIKSALYILESDIENQNYLNLLFGYGPYSYQRLTNGPYSSWESDYLHSLMVQGMIGLILVLFIYYNLLRRIIQGLRSDNYIMNSLATAGIITFIMSFFTLRLTGWHSAGVFIIIYNFLEKGLSREKGS